MSQHHRYWKMFATVIVMIFFALVGMALAVVFIHPVLATWDIRSETSISVTTCRTN